MSEDLIAEMQTEVAETVAKTKCQYLQLAAAIMRECDKPGMAGDIDQVRYALANRMRDNRMRDNRMRDNRMRDNRKQPEPDADLAGALVKGIHQYAELLRAQARRLHELEAEEEE